MKMTNFTIRIAGHTVSVSAMYESSRELCREYLCDGVPDFAVRTTPADIVLEAKKSRAEALLEGKEPITYSDPYLESTVIQRKITEALFDYDIILFHGSTIAVDGVAYLFTAKSGTGKSTHTRFWREAFGERAVMINDDKPFLQVSEEGITAHGSPWNGKHRLGGNISVPLKAICILERGEENEIHPISAQEALPMVFQQTHRPKNMGKYMEIIDKLTQRVAFYRLKCNQSPEAAKVAYEGMRP